VDYWIAWWYGGLFLFMVGHVAERKMTSSMKLLFRLVTTTDRKK